LLTHLHSLFFQQSRHPQHLYPFPTRRSSDLASRKLTDTNLLFHSVTEDSCPKASEQQEITEVQECSVGKGCCGSQTNSVRHEKRSEEHTSELQSLRHLVCRLLLEKKNKKKTTRASRARLSHGGRRSRSAFDRRGRHAHH